MRHRSHHRYQKQHPRLWPILCVLGAFGLMGCQTNQQLAGISEPTLQAPAPLSDSLASNYLMARHAVYANDLQSATSFFTKSLLYDDKDPALLRHSFLTQYQSGNIAAAADIARRMEALNMMLPLASEPA